MDFREKKEKEKNIIPLIDWQDWTANESDVISCNGKINNEKKPMKFILKKAFTLEDKSVLVYPWREIVIRRINGVHLRFSKIAINLGNLPGISVKLTLEKVEQTAVFRK